MVPSLFASRDQPVATSNSGSTMEGGLWAATKPKRNHWIVNARRAKHRQEKDRVVNVR
jgi:hypothetical protein